mmetsp:Transcript_1646/g.1452  ORF Transcript_1646/g.1452 Transcript_1646/m.1452 type:complete len:91 (-) Transcript_1646:42-314(-)
MTSGKKVSKEYLFQQILFQAKYEDRALYFGSINIEEKEIQKDYWRGLFKVLVLWMLYYISLPKEANQNIGDSKGSFPLMKMFLKQEYDKF